MADPSFRVRDVHGRPVPVAECTPDLVVAVERDRIPNVHVLRGPANIVDVPLERELGGVDADHHQPALLVLLSPCADMGEGAQPVDAGVRPEVDEHDLPAQALRGVRRRVEPAGRPVETGHVALRRRGSVAARAEQAHVAPPTSRIASANASGASSRLTIRYPLTETSPLQRSGQTAATMSAVRAPQSNPARIALSISSASSRAMTSSASAPCSPLRNVSSESMTAGPSAGPASITP